MSSTTSDPPPASSLPSPSTELKLFQTFIFSLPIFFSFILLFLFYWFYLRRRRVDWASLDMPTLAHGDDDGITRSELGLKKEIREMLPIIVYKESFSVHETQCSVCLGDYEAEEKLQQIPPCGHTFHMDCIDHWLATHTTCPLCRLSLLSPPKHEGNSESPEEETAVSEHREALAVEEEAVALGDEVKEVDFQLVGREAQVTSSM